MSRQFANAETNLFPELSQRFQATGQLSPLELWAILKWKANRASGKHLKRFGKGRGFVEVTDRIAGAIFKAPNNKDRLGALMHPNFGFRLPTASAILTALYPNDFIVYDFRICDRLNRFEELKHRRFSDGLWDDYQRYMAAAVDAAPEGLSLREVDHHHWGASWENDARDRLGL